MACLKLAEFYQKSTQKQTKSSRNTRRYWQMAENTLANSSQNLSEDEYRKLCKQVRQYQLAKKAGKKKAKPVLRPVGKVNVITRNITVEETPTDWEVITEEIFTLDINATQIFIKTAKERARNLVTGKSIPVGGASVYRVFL